MYWVIYTYYPNPADNQRHFEPEVHEENVKIVNKLVICVIYHYSHSMCCNIPRQVCEETKIIVFVILQIFGVECEVSKMAGCLGELKMCNLVKMSNFHQNH